MQRRPMTYDRTSTSVPPGSVDVSRRVWYPSKSQPQRCPQRVIQDRMQTSKQITNPWEQLFACAPCGMVLLNNHTVIQYLNPAAAHILGLEVDRVIGRVLADVIPSWKDTQFYASLPSLFGAQSTFESIDFDVPGPQMRQLRVSASYVPNG